MSTSDSSSIFATSPASTETAGPNNDNGECRLLGPFALFVQLALGGLALLALVYKRWRERPQRPVKIWFFDVSKQVFGSVLVHIANVFMSMLTSGRFSIKLTPTPARSVALGLMTRALGGRGDEYTPNPCSFYLLNLAIDAKTTLGIPILIILLRIYTSLVALTPLGKPRESIQSGNYGHPPNAWWWLKQSFIYFCGLFGMKICVLIIFLALPWISRVGDWALGWTEGDEKLQVVFVMMLFPLIMNAMQYYIIDSFIKLKETTGEVGDSDDGSDTSSEGGGEVYEGVPGVSDEEDEVSGDEEVDRKKKATTTFSPRLEGGEDREYDPDVDGDSQTLVIGSGSSRAPGETGRLLPKELYPHE
ncbi:hypothetical protein CONLIGDRAFT_639265 [Coniochaeta ligniaria NRRL 30616]|uniref:Vacuolar membrane protein n=1 Tax=Coniochaeta ligniaria NRRL 30616 TaxID=1408157 RepID=A0A1J7K418_9PEZI|nr:hypothetical protein CONLIGDRAFT_639265 [Coniochaeta ligniaria NRRL 30616]